MAFELYFNISRTAVEMLVLGVVVAGAVYVIKDLTDEEEEKTFVDMTPKK